MKTIRATYSIIFCQPNHRYRNVPIRSALPLLFRAIFGVTGALIVCFDIWWFKQAKNSETGFGGHHCDFEQHVSCLTVHVCMNSVKFTLEAPSASIFMGALLFRDNVQTHLGDGGGGALLLGRALLIGTLQYDDLYHQLQKKDCYFPFSLDRKISDVIRLGIIRLC